MWPSWGRRVKVKRQYWTTLGWTFAEERSVSYQILMPPLIASRFCLFKLLCVFVFVGTWYIYGLNVYIWMREKEKSTFVWVMAPCSCLPSTLSWPSFSAYLPFCHSQVDKYKICSAAPLGRILLVRLEKQRYWVEDNWFCLYVTVELPDGGTLTFPCYRWLVGNVEMELREGTGQPEISSQNKS